MLAQVEKIALELKMLRMGKIRIFFFCAAFIEA